MSQTDVAVHGERRNLIGTAEKLLADTKAKSAYEEQVAVRLDIRRASADGTVKAVRPP